MNKVPSRQLGLVAVFCITSGAMISSGIFVLPGLAHALAGPAVIFSYIMAGMLALMGLLSIAELTTAMPKAGGDYFYISRGMGPSAGLIAALLSWFSLSLKAAFALIGLSLLTAPFVPLNWHFLAVLWTILFTLINLKGTKEAVMLQIMLVFILMGLMLMYIFAGFGHINIDYYKPFTPKGLTAVFATTGFVFVSYGGLIQVASLAGEIKDPGKTIPRGMILSLVMMIVLYAFMVFVTSGILGPEELDNSLTPISDSAEVFLGRFGYAAITFAAALAFLTTANAGILTASRYLLALSLDELLPGRFSRMSKFDTPHFSIIITGLVIMVAVFLQLKILVEAASIVFILSYALASLSVIVLRQSGIQNYNPLFVAPFYPWVQVITILGAGFVLVEMGQEAFLIAAILIFTGFCFYWFYGRKRSSQESALLHLLERVFDKELVSGSLEEELKQVIRERDQIEKDEFDVLIERAAVYDLKETISSRQLYEMTASELAAKTGIGKEEISGSLIRKEKDTSPVITVNAAIPHAIVEKANTFRVVLVRSEKGVEFMDGRKAKIMFILVFSRDLRNLYLRVLAAIAQILQQPELEEKWLKAKKKQSLKDLVLLSQRKRIT